MHGGPSTWMPVNYTRRWRFSLCLNSLSLFLSFFLTHLFKYFAFQLNKMDKARCGRVAARVLVLGAPGSHMGASSGPSHLASHLAPWLWHGRAVENGPKPWDPAPTWETQRGLLSPGFGSAKLGPWSLLGEWTIGGRIFLSAFSSLDLPFQ